MGNFEIMREAGRRGWQAGLFSGFNGNMSLRLDNRIAVTCSGSAKGWLEPGDVIEVGLDGGEPLGPGCPSIETGLHLAVYRNAAEAQAVAHTHPPHLLAASLILPADELLRLPLIESGIYRPKLAMVPALPPGSGELATAVGEAARDHQAVFMAGHGLVCWGKSLAWALSLSEELENLARVQWMAEAGKHRAC